MRPILILETQFSQSIHYNAMLFSSIFPLACYQEVPPPQPRGPWLHPTPASYSYLKSWKNRQQKSLFGKCYLKKLKLQLTTVTTTLHLPVFFGKKNLPRATFSFWDPQIFWWDHRSLHPPRQHYSPLASCLVCLVDLLVLMGGPENWVLLMSEALEWVQWVQRAFVVLE